MPTCQTPAAPPVKRRGGGVFTPNSKPIDGYASMDADFLTSLRCPIDPARDATLTRDQQELVCDRCTVRYPVRNGIPILIIHEATLPDGCPSRHQLPCRVRSSD